MASNVPFQVKHWKEERERIFREIIVPWLAITTTDHHTQQKRVMLRTCDKEIFQDLVLVFVGVNL